MDITKYIGETTESTFAVDFIHSIKMLNEKLIK